MKKTIKKDLVAKAKELNTAIEQRRLLEKKEKELKEALKNYLGQDNAAQIGNFVVTLDDCNRTSLNKKELKEYLGDEITRFETTTSYKKFNIKKTA